MSNYEYQGMEFYKLSDSLEHLGSHCSIEIPKEYPFHKETGMFAVKGQDGVFLSAMAGFAMESAMIRGWKKTGKCIER